MRHNSPIFRGFSGPASALLNEPAMMKHGFFRREVEVFLRASHRPPDLADVIRRHRLAPPARGSVVDSLLANLKD